MKYAVSIAIALASAGMIMVMSGYSGCGGVTILIAILITVADAYAKEPDNTVPVEVPKSYRDEYRESIHPLENPEHPASVAYRITMSPHEWTWTQAEVENMARYIVCEDSIIRSRKCVKN